MSTSQKVRYVANERVIKVKDSGYSKDIIFGILVDRSGRVIGLPLWKRRPRHFGKYTSAGPQSRAEQ
jgi:hypothetical protein